MARAPRLLTDNWQLKLAALGLSIFLWALVQSEPLSQETFSAVPVVVEVADSSWSLSGVPSPPTVELRLGGPAREIIRLARDGTRLRIPVSSVGSRDTTVTIQREWVQLGPRAGVTVESVSPPVVDLTFEPTATTNVSLTLRTRGQLPSDLALSSPLAVSPERVTASGPESVVRGLTAIPVEPFDLGSVQESGVFALRVDTAGLGGAAVEPSEVELGVRVEPLEERVLTRIEVQPGVGVGQPDVVVDPPTIQLRLAGARSLVTTMDLSLLRVSIAPESVRGIVPGEVRRVRLQIDGVPPLIGAFPSTETVTVRRAGGESDRP